LTGVYTLYIQTLMARSAKKLYSLRLDPELWKWVDKYATDVGSNRTAVIEALLETLRAQRLWVIPDDRPNPFPGVTRPEILPVKPYPEGEVRPGTYPHRQKEKAHAG
jgi:hypothetical protein